jgi:stromal membrane-associated protein
MLSFSGTERGPRRKSTRRRRRIQSGVLTTRPRLASSECARQGYLTKRGDVRKNWKKRFFVLGADSNLRYYSSAQHWREKPTHPLGWVYVPGCRIEQTASMLGRNLAFSILPPAQGHRIYHLLADSGVQLSQWIVSLRAASGRAGFLSQPAPLPPLQQQQQIGQTTRVKSMSASSSSSLLSSSAERKSSLDSITIDRRAVAQVEALVKGNACSDCGAAGAYLVVARFGAIVCVRCAGVHRNLCAARVKSPRIDAFGDDEIELLRSIGGTEQFNRDYEARMPDDVKRPSTDAERRAFVERKYVRAEWRRQAEQQQQRRADADSSDSDRTSMPVALDQDPIGLLDIRLFGAKDLPVPPSLSSCDSASPSPYVAFDTGIQRAKSTVVAHSRSPFYMELLSLCVATLDSPLTIQVFHERSGTDDDDDELLGFALAPLDKLVPGIADRRRIVLDEASSGQLHVELTFARIGANALDNKQPLEVIEQLRSELDECRERIDDLKSECWQLRSQQQEKEKAKAKAKAATNDDDGDDNDDDRKDDDDDDASTSSSSYAYSSSDDDSFLDEHISSDSDFDSNSLSSSD